MRIGLGIIAALCCCIVLVSDLDAQRRGDRKKRRNSKGLKVAEMAPEFKLKSLDGKSEFDLAKAKKGKKPIVLIFGSYT